MNDERLLLGIDAGTTTLSFTLLNARTGAVVRSITLPHHAALPDAPGMQDADRIASLALETAGELAMSYPGLSAIGLTGQMHGVVCLDSQAGTVSPLYTWQCPLADAACCEDIFQKTGHRVHPGYGHATLYALSRSGALPANAVQYATIMDLIGMRLTGRSAPLMHSSNAASLGLYDLRRNAFDRKVLHALIGLEPPETTADSCLLGHFRGIPVSVAIGDNQASFFGSVREEGESLLLNYGTGSQLSLVSASPDAPPGWEARPYLNGRFLHCRCALCGGKAYAILEQFLRAYVRKAGAGDGPQYDVMNALALEAYHKAPRLRVCTQFCGTRENPALRGSIDGIGEENFTPGALILGTLQGMVDELAEAYDPALYPNLRTLVASGNAVQKNPVLRMLLADTFLMDLRLASGQEEAAFGAALCGGVSAGLLAFEQAKALISYRN